MTQIKAYIISAATVVRQSHFTRNAWKEN